MIVLGRGVLQSDKDILLRGWWRAYRPGEIFELVKNVIVSPKRVVRFAGHDFRPFFNLRSV